jgi:hypothetical protein
MGGDVADPGGVGQVPQRFGHAVVADGPVVFEQKAIGAQPGGPVVGDPVIEQLFELWVQWDVAVIVQFADPDPQPVGGADLHDRVDGEGQQLARRMPVRASSSTINRDNGSGSARAARSSLAAAASSRDRGQRFVDDRAGPRGTSAVVRGIREVIDAGTETVLLNPVGENVAEDP